MKGSKEKVLSFVLVGTMELVPREVICSVQGEANERQQSKVKGHLLFMA